VSAFDMCIILRLWDLYLLGFVAAAYFYVDLLAMDHCSVLLNCIINILSINFNTLALAISDLDAQSELKE
jgi:mannose/fructose/N-acetylgalactosamine-specific phosphotransferase system component IIC